MDITMIEATKEIGNSDVCVHIYIYEKNISQPPADRLSQLVITWLNLSDRSWSQRYHSHSVFFRTATMIAVFCEDFYYDHSIFVRTTIMVAVFYEDCDHGRSIL